MGGGMRGGRERRPMVSGARFSDLPTETEVEGPPDLQTLSLSADVDTTGLSAYATALAAYRDSTRPARDSIWVVLQRTRPGGDIQAPDSAEGRPRGGFAVVQRLWPDLKKRDEAFIKDALKPAMPKKEFKKWEKWHDDEVDQARKERESERGGGGFRR